MPHQPRRAEVGRRRGVVGAPPKMGSGDQQRVEAWRQQIRRPTALGGVTAADQAADDAGRGKGGEGPTKGWGRGVARKERGEMADVTCYVRVDDGRAVGRSGERKLGDGRSHAWSSSPPTRISSSACSISARDQLLERAL